MEWRQIYFLIVLTFSTMINRIVRSSSSSCQDSLQQWEEHEWICGFGITKISDSIEFPYFRNSMNPLNDSTVRMTDAINSSDGVRLENSSDILVYDENNQSTRQIIISYEDFRCCLKNIVNNIRSPQQREKCLVAFFECVTKVKTEKCIIQWRFYMNMILHDEKFMLVIIFILLAAFMAVLFSTYKCNNNSDYPILVRENLRR